MRVALVRQLVLASALFATSAFGQSRDPLGEYANYELDRDSSRTSSIITGGDLRADVTAALPDDTDGPSHEVTIEWSLRIQAIGSQSGDNVVKVPNEYFAPEFLVELRRTGSYTGPSFKLRHMGFADARNKDGAFYPNCDLVLIYDIEDEGEIDDLEILAHVSYGVPVLGAVKMDMSGKYRGQRIKAGSDYETP